MAKAALISDIHGNLEALTAVLADIDARGIDEIICLGDIVGYGPNPIECVDLVRSRCSLVIRGNHDEALVKEPWGFNQLARDAIEWAKKQLRPRVFKMGSRARWQFLAELPTSLEWGDYLLVHGSPRDPTAEYVLPQQVSWPPPGMFEEIFAKFENVCFAGHTHVAGVFGEGPTFVAEHEISGPFNFEGEKLLINVGSVGQPRDRNWKSCYLTIDSQPGTERGGEESKDDVSKKSAAEGGQQVRFQYHRVAYPVELTQRKIRDIAELDDRLADRLASGE